jgi:long-chain fatty acid transport protein
MTSTTRTIALMACLAGAALTARPCFASGFLVYDVSGQALGRASAVSADDPEPAAIWFNPANLTDLPGVHASAGGTFVTAQASFSPAGGGPETQTERSNSFLPALFASGLITDRVAVGLGAFSAFGLSVHWPDDWVGREASIKAKIETLDLNPTVAVRTLPQLSLAAGFNAVRSVVDFTNGLPALIGGDVRLAAGTWGFGFNLAMLFKAYPDRFHVAVAYRSRVKLDFTGQANFSPTNPDFAAALPDQSATTSVTLPDIITVGFMGRPRPNLSLTFDSNVVLWETFDRVDVHFPNAPTLTMVPNGKTTFTFRWGADWQPQRVPGLHARGGLIYDHTAIPSTNLGPTLPDASRVDVALGAGYGIGHFSGDLGYLLVVFLPHDSTTGQEGPVGTYRTIAHLLGVTLRVVWP